MLRSKKAFDVTPRSVNLVRPTLSVWDKTGGYNGADREMLENLIQDVFAKKEEK